MSPQNSSLPLGLPPTILAMPSMLRPDYRVGVPQRAVRGFTPAPGGVTAAPTVRPDADGLREAGRSASFCICMDTRRWAFVRVRNAILRRQRRRVP